MSSEHAVERVPLLEIREGDMLQDPRSGKWIKVEQTATQDARHRRGNRGIPRLLRRRR